MITEPTGVVCKVCKTGELIYDSFEDFHCNVCGVRYKFLPAETLSPPVSSDSMFQFMPGNCIARESTSVFKKNR